MRWISLVIIVAGLGCAGRGDRHRTASGDEAAIAVGQPWPHAERVARRAGYALHDASELAIVPRPDGFYINMPGNRGLLVHRDRRRQLVESLVSVENWDGPKQARVYRQERSFRVPPAEPETP